MNIKISREVAAHVLWHFRGEGYQPGSFIEALLIAFARADSYNRSTLSGAFPQYGAAFSMAVDEMDGIEKLRQIFRGESE